MEYMDLWQLTVNPYDRPTAWGKVVPARASPTYIPHPLPLCCNYPAPRFQGTEWPGAHLPGRNAGPMLQQWARSEVFIW